MKSNKTIKMRFLESAYNEIVNTIGSQHAESGGLLFGYEDEFIVRKFLFDKNAKVTNVTYSFDVDYLNPDIKRLWKNEKLSCIGFIHSHPYGYESLSSWDLDYFKRKFVSAPRMMYLTPIVQTVRDGGFKLIPHILFPGANKTSLASSIELLPDNFPKESLDFSDVVDDKSKEIDCSIADDNIENYEYAQECFKSKEPQTLAFCEKDKLDRIIRWLNVTLWSWFTIWAILFGSFVIYICLKVIYLIELI